MEVEHELGSQFHTILCTKYCPPRICFSPPPKSHFSSLNASAKCELANRTPLSETNNQSTEPHSLAITYSFLLRARPTINRKTLVFIYDGSLCAFGAENKFVTFNNFCYLFYMNYSCNQLAILSVIRFLRCWMDWCDVRRSRTLPSTEANKIS